MNDHVQALVIACVALGFAISALVLAGIVWRLLVRELRDGIEADRQVAELAPYSSYVRCLDVCPSGPGYRCVKPVGHDGQHGYAGMFWPNVE